MSSIRTPLHDDQLSAWLDGELNTPERQAERAAVEAWLHDHPEDAARARLWAADAEACARGWPRCWTSRCRRRCATPCCAGPGPCRAGAWPPPPPACCWPVVRPGRGRPVAMAAAPGCRHAGRGAGALGAARRGGARRLRARAAPCGGSEGAGRTPGTLAHAPHRRAGEAVRPARAGFRTGGRPPAARRQRQERAADVPGRAGPAGHRLPAQARGRHAGRVPLRTAGQPGSVLLGGIGRRLRAGGRAAQGTAAGLAQAIYNQGGGKAD
jgi:hypothetical protein